MDILERRDLAWCEIDGHLIFLDIAKDRYFRLSDTHNRDALEVLDRTGRERWWQPPSLPSPSGWITPAAASSAMGEGAFHLAELARAMWIQRRVERRLASRSFSSVIFDMRRALEARCHQAASSHPVVRRTIRAFELSRLLRTAADRCLPRSIALALCLAGRGVRSHVVLGVKLAPFGAHCWVQAGDEVLNDSVEEVLRYRPILIV